MKFEIELKNLPQKNNAYTISFFAWLKDIKVYHDLDYVISLDSVMIFFECDSIEDLICNKIIDLLDSLKTNNNQITSKIHMKFILDYSPGLEKCADRVIQFGVCTKLLKIDHGTKYYLASAILRDDHNNLKTLYDRIIKDHKCLILNSLNS